MTISDDSDRRIFQRAHLGTFRLIDRGCPMAGSQFAILEMQLAAHDDGRRRDVLRDRPFMMEGVCAQHAGWQRARVYAVVSRARDMNQTKRVGDLAHRWRELRTHEDVRAGQIRDDDRLVEFIMPGHDSSLGHVRLEQLLVWDEVRICHDDPQRFERRFHKSSAVDCDVLRHIASPQLPRISEPAQSTANTPLSTEMIWPLTSSDGG